MFVYFIFWLVSILISLKMTRHSGCEIRVKDLLGIRTIPLLHGPVSYIGDLVFVKIGLSPVCLYIMMASFLLELTVLTSVAIFRVSKRIIELVNRSKIGTKIKEILEIQVL